MRRRLINYSAYDRQRRAKSKKYMYMYINRTKSEARRKLQRSTWSFTYCFSASDDF